MAGKLISKGDKTEARMERKVSRMCGMFFNKSFAAVC